MTYIIYKIVYDESIVLYMSILSFVDDFSQRKNFLLTLILYPHFAPSRTNNFILNILVN